MEALEQKQCSRIKGTAVYVTSDYTRMPFSLEMQMRFHGAVHEDVLIVMPILDYRPRVPWASYSGC